MGIGKSLTKILAPVLMAGALAFSIPKEAEAEPYSLMSSWEPENINTSKFEPYFIASFQADLSLGTPLFNIQSVPEYMRNVPIHPNDTYVPSKNGAPVRDSHFSLTPIFKLEGRAGIGFANFDGFGFSFGAKTGLELLWGGKIERNYTNDVGSDKRGYGAALTYYMVNAVRWDVGAFAKAVFLNFISAEYSIDFPYSQGIEVSNGWDRWNSLEPKDNYFADFKTLNHTLKVGGRLPFVLSDISPWCSGVEAFIGLKFPQIISQSDAVKQMGLTPSPNFFCGLEVDFGYSKKLSGDD